MTLNNARPLHAGHWMKAERLGQLNVDAAVQPWLIGKGLLTQRMKAACGDKFASRLTDLWTGLLDETHKAGLRVADNAGLFREVELCNGDQVWVFAQTVIPDSTLCLHPWLAELGDSSLGETLSELSGVERSSCEYALLPPDDALAGRALREADLKRARLWARRSRVQLRGAPLLVQEVFLPALGRS